MELFIKYWRLGIFGDKCWCLLISDGNQVKHVTSGNYSSCTKDLKYFRRNCTIEYLWNISPLLSRDLKSLKLLNR